MSKIIQDISFLCKKSENTTSINEVKGILLELEDALKPLDNGVGLAAIQIGHAKRIGAIKRSDGSFIHLINPEVVEKTDEFIFLNEGCLSFPGLYKDTKRYHQIIIKNKRIEDDRLEDEVLSFYHATDPTEPGNDGLIAIAVQHELDHFEGMTILDHNIINIPIMRTEQKIGRNDPCPCGSSKKYKKCCGK